MKFNLAIFRYFYAFGGGGDVYLAENWKDTM